MLYQDYDAETLKKLQKLELEILKDFNDLCNKYDIDYFACGGTAIGAVRHGGFIPWDDDIDVGLLRKDYDKFIKVAEKEYPGKYKLLCAETNPNFPAMSARFYRVGTVFKEETFKDLDFECGVFLDLYCFDNIADDEKNMKRQARSAWFWGKMMVLSAVKNPTIYYHGWKATVLRSILRLGYHTLRLLNASPHKFYQKAKKSAIMYKNKKTKRVAFFFDPTPYTSVMNVDDILPTKRMNYDGINIRVPNKIEAYLETRYGDYMTLPPEDKRHNHPPNELFLGEDME